MECLKLLKMFKNLFERIKFKLFIIKLGEKEYSKIKYKADTLDAMRDCVQMEIDTKYEKDYHKGAIVAQLKKSVDYTISIDVIRMIESLGIVFVNPEIIKWDITAGDKKMTTVPRYEYLLNCEKDLFDLIKDKIPEEQPINWNRIFKKLGIQ